MVKCTFCGSEIEKGTGKTKILKEGKAVELCSMKCEKNMFKLKRTPRRVKWTEAYHKEKTMRLSTAKTTKKKVAKK